ncbi:hypothetical protein EVAR_89559_1 [Eumeta japonica]|uniref:ATP-dependent DNA helicase n=1 Tax=Eumeta variegata TaxID=151549 RepID=A0A4C1YNS5_EUMVA|nr:hypothetical protein EVAR_89559_1 [Eumeta japonica]
MDYYKNQQGGIIFLDTPGGTGKTFLINIILAEIRAKKEIVLVLVSSGIAATLRDSGRTAHSGLKLPLNVTDYEFRAHPQEIADSHIHQGARSVKTINTTSLSGPLSCSGQRATKTFLRQPQTTTDRHACQMSQTNHHPTLPK